MPAPPSAATPFSQASTPPTNPFAGWPVSDYIRDAAAAVCLLSAMGKPWDLGSQSSDRWWVIIAVLISLASLALPYLAKTNAIPGLTLQHYRLAKFAAGVPLLASVLVALINEIVNLSDPSSGGVGAGVALATAGGVLAVTPRHADEEPTQQSDVLWGLAARTAAGAAVAAGVITTIAYVIHDVTGFNYLFDSVKTLIGFLLWNVSPFVVMFAIPAIGYIARRQDSRRVFVAVGFSVLAVALFANNNGEGGFFAANLVEKWDSPAGGTFLLAAAAALATARPLSRVESFTQPLVPGWIATARAALMISAVGLVVTAAALLFWTISYRLDGLFYLSAVLMVAQAVSGFVAASMLKTIQRTRGVVLAIIGVQLLLAVIAAALYANDGSVFGVDGWQTAMWFTLPAVAAYALVGPAEVRSTLGPIVAPTTQRSVAPAPPGWQPSPPMPPSSPSSSPPNGPPPYQGA